MHLQVLHFEDTPIPTARSSARSPAREASVFFSNDMLSTVNNPLA